MNYFLDFSKVGWKNEIIEHFVYGLTVLSRSKLIITIRLLHSAASLQRVPGMRDVGFAALERRLVDILGC